MKSKEEDFLRDDIEDYTPVFKLISDDKE